MSLLPRLAIVYGQPDSPDPAAYMAEIAKMLGKYSASELETAGDTIIRTHRNRFFPTPSEIVTACEEARSANRPVQKPSFETDYPEWSAERIARADKMICCAMGKRAADEGWVLRIHQFCRENCRLPTDREIPDLRASAKGFDEAYRKCAAGEAGAASAALKRLGDLLLDKRDRLGHLVDGTPPTLTDRSLAMTGEAK